MRFAQILWNKAHWVFEAAEKPDFPPGPEGEEIVVVDITDKPEVQEGWDYNAETGEFAEPCAGAEYCAVKPAGSWRYGRPTS